MDADQTWAWKFSVLPLCGRGFFSALAASHQTGRVFPSLLRPGSQSAAGHFTASAGAGASGNPRGSLDVEVRPCVLGAMPAPDELFTSLRCVRERLDADVAVCELLPRHVAQCVGVARDRFSSHADFQLMQAHPLAEHVPLWPAHVYRLVQNTATLARLYPGSWSSEISVADVLGSGAVADLWALVQNMRSERVLRASLRVARGGALRLVTGPLELPLGNDPLPVRLDTQATSVAEPLALLKTSERRVYDDARARVHASLKPTASVADGMCFDALMWRQDAEKSQRFATEFSIANLVVELRDASGSVFVTPAFQQLLPGLLVQDLVQRGIVSERAITVADLSSWSASSSTRFWLCNAVRGMMEVKLV